MRELYQWMNMILNIIIFLSAVLSCRLRPDKKFSLFMWIVYGAVGIIFYAIVLIGHNGMFGNDYSPLRNLIQDAIVASSLFWLSFGDLWKRLKN